MNKLTVSPERKIEIVPLPLMSEKETENSSKRGPVMHIRILEKDENQMRFIVDGINPPLANTLRRIIISEVPSMAIDEVVIIENSSVLHDEILALRLGLIPLKTDLDSYNLPEECTCKSELGCNLCRTVLTLDIQTEDNVRTVYSGDFNLEDPDVTPISDKIPIAKLAPGQKIKLEAYAKLGKGKNHVKWQPTSSCVYRYMPILKIDSSSCDACGRCVEICPKHILVKDKDKIKMVNQLECTLCEDCVDACEKDPQAIHVGRDEATFIFHVESVGALQVERIITEAFNIFEKKFSDFMNQMVGFEREPEKTS